jgi:glyoxylate reductase
MTPLILNAAPLHKAQRAALAQDTGCELVDIDAAASPATLSAEDRLRVIGWLCTMRSPVNNEALQLLPALRVVSTRAVGFDNIDVAAAKARGILIGYTPGVLNRAVADLAFALILCLLRDVFGNDRFVRSGAWLQGYPPLSRDPKGKTLGLLGLGRIGGELARLAHACGMQVIYHQRNRDAAMEAAGIVRFVGREELLRTADVLSIHLPLSAQTRGSVGQQELGWMKPSAYLVNTSRGDVVDEPALIAALREKQIAGAGLDVMQTEPLDPGHALCTLPNVILQPHAGSATEETRTAMMDLAVRNLVEGLAGRAMPQGLA